MKKPEYREARLAKGITYYEYVMADGEDVTNIWVQKVVYSLNVMH